MAGIALSGGRGRGNGFILVAALAFGLLTAALVVGYLRDQSRKQQVRSETSVPVVIAKRDIPLGVNITSNMVELKLVTPDIAVNSAFSETGRVIGLRARYPITAGAQVVPGMVVQSGAADALSYVVPPGKRALAVIANEVVGSSGYIRPGDFVDVLVSLPESKLPGGRARTGSDEAKAVLTVLQNVEVLAVADEAQKVAGAVPDGKKDGARKAPANSENKSVTLAVDPEQAQILFLAETEGKLRLALRPFGERDEKPLPATLLDPPAAVATAVPAAPSATPRATPAPR